jgi:hypothetical protein
MDHAESKLDMKDIQEDAYPKKKKSVADQFAEVKYRSDTYCWNLKLNRQDYGNFCLRLISLCKDITCLKCCQRH